VDDQTLKTKLLEHEINIMAIRRALAMTFVAVCSQFDIRAIDSLVSKLREPIDESDPVASALRKANNNLADEIEKAKDALNRAR